MKKHLRNSFSVLGLKFLFLKTMTIQGKDINNTCKIDRKKLFKCKKEFEELQKIKVCENMQVCQSQ